MPFYAKANESFCQNISFPGAVTVPDPATVPANRICVDNGDGTGRWAEVDTSVEEAKTRLAEIDLLSMRPLRAIQAGTASDTDRERLAELEAEACELRSTLVASE